MSFYWSLNSVPEIATLTKQRRKEILREIESRPRGHWYWAVRLPCTFGIFWIARRTFPFYGGLFVARLAVIGALICTLTAVLNHFWITKSLPEIRKLAGGLCRSCGYDLRATPDRCPECGEEAPAESKEISN
ncbi:MAG: hypothetical protein JWL69_3674 [Phycisphaerales bacterium]|nr:hypothetical protein [Phycisphaerales bacterium]